MYVDEESCEGRAFTPQLDFETVVSAGFAELLHISAMNSREL